ncbi:unannotated protein [freshwater metagenome]|uniref:Unannotated protein n=1 Tax=freshwater metagenome TaxID=449393 RepID=A0A6J7L543_9ZZZZ
MPPLAVSVWLYATPVVPTGRLPVDTVGPVADEFEQRRAEPDETTAWLKPTCVPAVPSAFSTPMVALAPLSLAVEPVRASRYWKVMSPVPSSINACMVTPEPATENTATLSHVTTNWRLGALPFTSVQMVPPAVGLRSSHHGATKLLGSLVVGMPTLE